MMERTLLTLIFIFLEIIGSLSQAHLNPSTVLPPPLSSVSPPPSSSTPSLRSPARSSRRSDPREGVSSPNSSQSTPPPSHRHSPRPPPPPRNGRQNGGHTNGNRQITKTSVQKINVGKKIGFLFAGIASILQVAVVGFLVLKRRQISKIKDRHDT